MSIKLIDGLSDLSKELGETSANTTTNRIRHYNDAMLAFFTERKWPFGTKKNSTLTTVKNQAKYSLATITDIRMPGGIKEIQIGDDAVDNPAYIPLSYSQRHMPQFQGQRYFYIDEETNELVFISIPDTTGLAINIRYFYVPERIESLDSTDEFPVPDQFRKLVATLAAAYVQWGRYLDAQGNRLYNMYERLLVKTETQQAERNNMNPRKFEHPLRWKGFRRVYPNGR